MASESEWERAITSLIIYIEKWNICILFHFHQHAVIFLLLPHKKLFFVESFFWFTMFDMMRASIWISSKLFFISFTVPPDILDYPTSTDMIVRENSNVTLRCAAVGSPAPTITWRREGGEKIMLSNETEGENYCYGN